MQRKPRSSPVITGGSSCYSGSIDNIDSVLLICRHCRETAGRASEVRTLAPAVALLPPEPRDGEPYPPARSPARRPAAALHKFTSSFLAIDASNVTGRNSHHIWPRLPACLPVSSSRRQILFSLSSRTVGAQNANLFASGSPPGTSGSSPVVVLVTYAMGVTGSDSTEDKRKILHNAACCFAVFR